MKSEEFDLAVLGKLLNYPCKVCRAPLMLSAEVRARFDPRDERWHATVSCTSCGADWTPLARALTALDHRKGPRMLKTINDPTVWDPRG